MATREDNEKLMNKIVKYLLDNDVQQGILIPINRIYNSANHSFIHGVKHSYSRLYTHATDIESEQNIVSTAKNISYSSLTDIFKDIKLNIDKIKTILS